jgi:ATP-binding cassette subfamily B multidrug efflux pump
MLHRLLEPFQYQRFKWNETNLNSNPDKKRATTANVWGTLKRMGVYLSYKKALLAIVLFLVIVSSFLALLGPFLIGVAIDEYIVTHNPSGLISLLGGLVTVYILYSVSLWCQNYGMIGIAQSTVYELRKQLFHHLHRLPIPYFDQRQHGEIMSRMTNDIDQVSSTLNSSVIQIFSSLLTLIGTVSVMLWISPLLTLITVLVVPLMFYGMKWITHRTSKLFKQQQRHLGGLNGFIEETISGQRIVKSFSQESRVISEFVTKSEQLKGVAFWAQTYSGFIPKLMNMLNNLSFALIAGIGGIFALNNMISIGSIVIFAEYSRQFTRPLNDLANQFNTLLSAVAGAERVFEVLDEKMEEEEGEESGVLPQVRGEVEFRNVSFSYDKKTPTVTGIHFHAQPGETIAFVGPTGAGKTTMINLLSRFYDADEGHIYIDGIEIKKIKRRSLRSHMAFVLQDSYLFDGTVRENIRYGKLDATDQEVIDAAKLANAHFFIMKLPHQYDTVLLQDESGISQGQKQLLSIARAVLANPSILILDEATSSIDTITEMKIQEALQRLMQGRTSFVIAHRLNTIQKADRILVFQNGTLVEQGTHHSLLQQRGYYEELYHS